MPTRLTKGGALVGAVKVPAGTAIPGLAESVAIATLDTTLTAADSHKTVIMNAATTKTVTLPSAAAAPGLTFTVTQQQVPASGAGLTVHPAGTDVMRGNGFTPAAGKGAINTQATGRIGDAITVQSDGVSAWYITSLTGTWAREP